MDPLSELQDDLTVDDTSQALNQLKLASIDEKNWPSDEMPDFPKSDDSKSSSPEPVTHLKWDDPYYDIARHQIVEVAGDDKYGRKIIVFSACRMPPSHQLDHSKLLGYLKHTLDQYVESDYTLLYLHHGLTSDNKPSLSWLRDAYREFDRKWVGFCVGSRAWGSAALPGSWLPSAWEGAYSMPGGSRGPLLGKLNTTDLRSEWPGLKSQFLCLLTL